MKRVGPDEGIRKLVECYSNIQLSYELGEGSDVLLDLVHVREVSSPCMITVENY